MTGIIFHQLDSGKIWLLLAVMLLIHVVNKFIDKSLFKTSLVIPALFILLGYCHSYYYQASQRPEVKNLENYPQCLLQVEEFPMEKNNFYKVKALCLQVKDSVNSHPAAMEPVLIFLEKDSLSEKLKPGQQLSIACKWSKESRPTNPEAFDYQKFLKRKNIRYQAFIRQGQWILTEHKAGFSLLHQTRVWQKQMTAQMDQTIGDSIVSSIAKAILLGDTEDLDTEVKNSFSLTGTMHVLAVSGMHVVVIFMILQMLFTPVKNSRIRAAIILSILWFYAMLTGLSPSVLRSVVMFSFVLIGQEINRKTSVYNSLALAALVLAIIEPAMIFSVGFQLSFLAVLGIVFFHPYFLQWFPTEVKWKKYILELILLSLAAQLSTFPLSIYYFHQFPNYFLLGNILIVPLSTPILVLSLCVLVFSPVPYLNDLLSWCLIMVTKLTIFIGETIAAIPHSSSSGIPFNGLECVLCYLLMIAFSAWLIYKKSYYLRLVLLFLGGIIAVPVFQFVQNREVKQLIIYQVKGKSCMEIQSGNKLYFFGDEPNPTERNYNIEPNLLARGFNGNMTWKGEETHWQKLPFGKAAVVFDKRILVLNDSAGLKTISGIIETDLLIVSANLRIYGGKLVESFRFRKLVLDSSNDSRTRKYWAKQAVKFGFEIYDIAEEGAFIWNFYE